MTQANQLQVVNGDHPLIREVAKQDAIALIDQYLVGKPIDSKKLLTSLMMEMTLRPDLQQCTPQSIYNCLLVAAQHGQTFGKYGVWIVPRKVRNRQKQVIRIDATPQVGYQAKNTAVRERGGHAIYSEVVLKGEPFEVVKDAGVVVAIEHTINYTERPEPTEANVVAAYAIIEHEQGRFYRILPKHELSRAHKAAATRPDSDTPWNTDFGAMCKKTAEHRADEDFVGDFTRGGMVPAPVAQETEPEDLKIINPAVDLADELNSRARNAVTSIAELDTDQAVAAVELAGTIDVLKAMHEQEMARTNEAGERRARKAVVEAIKARKAQIEADEAEQEFIGDGDSDGEQAGGDAPPDDAAAASPLGESGPPPASSEQPAEGGAPDESGNGAPPEQSGGGNPDGAPAGTTQAKAEIPPFPDLPGTLTDYEGDPKTALGAAIVEIKDAWKKLKKSPDAVEALFKRRQQEWGGAFDQAEHNQYPVLKQTVAGVLEAAGLPHTL